MRHQQLIASNTFRTKWLQCINRSNAIIIRVEDRIATVVWNYLCRGHKDLKRVVTNTSESIVDYHWQMGWCLSGTGFGTICDQSQLPSKSALSRRAKASSFYQNHPTWVRTCKESSIHYTHGSIHLVL